jgi:hypothetical protein
MKSLSSLTRHVFGRKSKSVGLIPSRFNSFLVSLLYICQWRSLPHILSYCYFYQCYHHIFGLSLWRFLLIDYFDPLIWQFSPSCFIYFLRFLSYKVINGPKINVATFWDVIPYSRSRYRSYGGTRCPCEQVTLIDWNGAPYFSKAMAGVYHIAWHHVPEYCDVKSHVHWQR